MLAIDAHHRRRDAERRGSVLDVLGLAEERPDRMADVMEAIVRNAIAPGPLQALAEALAKDEPRVAGGK
jgi:hypothetical protein